MIIYVWFKKAKVLNIFFHLVSMFPCCYIGPGPDKEHLHFISVKGIWQYISFLASP